MVATHNNTTTSVRELSYIEQFSDMDYSLSFLTSQKEESKINHGDFISAMYNQIHGPVSILPKF